MEALAPHVSGDTVIVEALPVAPDRPDRSRPAPLVVCCMMADLWERLRHLRVSFGGIHRGSEPYLHTSQTAARINDRTATAAPLNGLFRVQSDEIDPVF
jgi:hypothetical protein